MGHPLLNGIPPAARRIVNRNQGGGKGATTSKIMSKPTAKCPNCEQSAEYVRTRYVHDGSSHVFWCGNRECKSHDLYFHVDGKDICQECGGAGQFNDGEGMPELCEKCMGDGGKP